MEKGLSQNDVQERLQKYGKNVVPSKTVSSALEIFYRQFPTVINGILAIAAIFSFLLHNILDGGFILAIIFVNACFGFMQEFRAQKSLEKLKDYTSPTARVIRDQKEEQILAEDLVPDDIVILSEGTRVPADGTLVEITHLEIDESILTGESLAVMKVHGETVFSGTLVTKGKGLFHVDKTGAATRFGQIATTLSTITDEITPLQKNLDQLGKILSFAALIAGLIIIPIGIFNGEKDIFALILVAVSIGIAAIPEGLPAVVTIAFSIGSHQMAKRGAIVRKMAAVETLGAIQVILVDKTGTITQNAMRVKKYWVENKASFPKLLEACVFGNTASLIEKGNGRDYEIMGDQTDGALLLWAKQQETPPEIPDAHVLDEYMFDNETKTITTVWKKQGKKYVYVRGAPESILEKSTLNQAEKKAMLEHIQTYAGEGLRIIGFAIKTESHMETNRTHLEQGLTFLGIIGIYDPPRKEIKEAIKKARTAGIHVAMVTGDSELTALSLSKEIGLIQRDEDVVTGAELSKMTDDELAAIVLKTSIFARTQPEDKLRIATVLKDKGFVVGVTGDGVNDALALKKADVGIAMGEGGTDVAKEASDIILTDDNFATLIKAIEEGRGIYKNITNAVLYLLSGNLAEISLVFFAAVFQLPFPLLPTQILWINLITDSLPALALATGSRDATVLHHKPRDPNAPMLDFHRTLLICLIGFSLAGFLLFLFTILLQTNSEGQSRTVVFNLLIYFHLLIVIGIGRHSLKRGNIFLILTIIIILLLQGIINAVPLFQELFHLVG
jgi:Ca2+-transporting ATPase